MCTSGRTGWRSCGADRGDHAADRTEQEKGIASLPEVVQPHRKSVDPIFARKTSSSVSSRSSISPSASRRSVQACHQIRLFPMLMLLVSKRDDMISSLEEREKVPGVEDDEYFCWQ